MYAYHKFYSLSMKKFTLQKSIVMKFGEVIVVPKVQKAFGSTTYLCHVISPIGFIKIGQETKKNYSKTAHFFYSDITYLKIQFFRINSSSIAITAQHFSIRRQSRHTNKKTVSTQFILLKILVCSKKNDTRFIKSKYLCYKFLNQKRSCQKIIDIGI